MSSSVLSVRKFYEGKSILITGGTGSIGKLLVQKLLKSCPDIGQIYLVVRPKKGQTVEERIANVLATPIFDDLKLSNPTILSKIVAINGNLCEKNLGLSEINLETIINEISIVFHCAAILRFDLPLEEAMENNVFGTRNLLEICWRMNKIEAFIHVSTLYSTCNQPLIEECIPSIPALKGKLNFKKNIKDFVSDIPTEIAADWPNTYTFSKAIAEIMLNEYRETLPISIMRPSIILSAMTEPMPGWIDNYYGPTLAIINGGLGILRSILYDGDTVGDVIPTDLVVNSLICIGCQTKYRQTKEITVYNCCSGRRNPILKGNWLDSCTKFARNYPFINAIRYPNLTHRTSRIIHGIISTFQHGLLSYIIDFISYCRSQKRRLIKIHRRTKRILDLQQIFYLTGWRVVDHNLERLNKTLSDEERRIFYTDPKLIDWNAYTRNYVLGIREYLLQEDPGNLEEATRRMNKLYWTEKCLQCSMLIGSLVIFNYGFKSIAQSTLKNYFM